MDLTLTEELQQIKFANFLKVKTVTKDYSVFFPLLYLIAKLKQLRPNFT